MKLSRLTAVLMIFGLLAWFPKTIAEEAQSGACGDQLTWTYENGTLTVTGSGPMYDYEEGKSPWTPLQNELVTVVLPDELSSIGSYAFYLCNKIQEIHIPDQVETIGEYAFAHCYSLQSISLPDRITDIANCTFEYCSELETVDLPSELKSIGAGAFQVCSMLQSVDIPDSVTNIGNSAFRCSGLTNVILPEGITTLNGGVFSQCESLRTVSLPDGLVSIGGGAFMYSGIESIEIPDTVKEIGSDAFEFCERLREIRLPYGITNVLPGTFCHCHGLERVFLPDSVEIIGHGAFTDCESLQTITMPCDIVYWDDTPSGWSFPFEELPSLREVRLTAGNGRMLDLRLPGVSGDNHQYNQTPWYQQGGRSISIILEDDISYVGKYAFAYSPEITEITFCDSLKEIAAYAFFNNSGLTEIRFPDGLEKIGNGAFVECSRLKTVTIPNTVTTIGGQAFYLDDAITDVYYLGTKEERLTNLPDENIGGNNGTLLQATWHYLGEVAFAEMDSADVQYKGTTPYVVYDGKAQTPRVIAKDFDGNVIDTDGYTVTYRDNTAPGTAYADITWDDSGRKISVMFKIYLPATTGTTVANGKDGIKIAWTPVDGAAGYVIYRRAWNSTTNGWTSFERWNNTPATSWTDTKVYAGTRYQYGVKAYFAQRTDPVSGAKLGGAMDNVNLGVVGPLKTTVRITTRSLKSVTAGTKQLTAKWDGSKVFTGYQVQIATDAGFTKNAQAVKVKNTAYQTTFKNLKANTTYYVRVRSYHEFAGMTYFGEWSNVLSCKVR